jgi:hypothetical protein
MGHHSDTTNAIYNIVTDDRQKSVAGNSLQCPPSIRERLEEISATARKEGIDLSTVQSELRQAWRVSTLGNFGQPQ